MELNELPVIVNYAAGKDQLKKDHFASLLELQQFIFNYLKKDQGLTLKEKFGDEPMLLKQNEWHRMSFTGESVLLQVDVHRNAIIDFELYYTVGNDPKRLYSVALQEKFPVLAALPDSSLTAVELYTALPYIAECMKFFSFQTAVL